MSKCPIGDEQRKMVNFKLGEEIRKDGIPSFLNPSPSLKFTIFLYLHFFSVEKNPEGDFIVFV